MGIKDWLFKSSRDTKWAQVSCKEMFQAAKEYQIRNLAFWTCVNMIANALSKCEFRTFKNKMEVQEREYYLWNIEPNTNQSRKAFMDKLVAKLYTENEALVIEAAPRGGEKMLVVADSWASAEDWPVKQHEYSQVVVGDYGFNKTFRENEVLHFRLNYTDTKPLIDGFYDSYYRLIAATTKAYEWSKGQHWKVHVDQLAEGADDWETNFQKMIEAQVKPFLQSNRAILPEFDGYKYEDVGSDSTQSQSDTTIEDTRKMISDVFDFTAKALMIPPVLVSGTVENTTDAMNRWLTIGIDPLCKGVFQEEIVRKRYGFESWSKGDTLMIDTSTIVHFDMMANAENIARLISSGYSYNDILRAQGQPPIDEPWAKAHFMTKNNELASSFLEGGEKE